MSEAEVEVNNVNSEDDQKKIQLGDYIIIQRQKYYKLVKFSNLEVCVVLGKDKLELKGLLNQPYSATFKMCPTNSVTMRRGNKQRICSLELCSESDMNDIYSILDEYASGSDNRNISDIGDSQALDSEDIDQLRQECTNSVKIIEKIVENSKTFQSKTEFSQKKYLTRKEKKYFEYIQIRQPSIRLLSEIYYRQDQEKVMGLRFDMLAQIVAYSSVCGFGNYLLYESGSNGLVPATFLNSIGSKTEACLVHMHPGNIPQIQAILALNLPKEQLNRCISVNIYSVLRTYYQREDLLDKSSANTDKNLDDEIPTSPCNKKLKLSKTDVDDNDLCENHDKVFNNDTNDEKISNKPLPEANGDKSNFKLLEPWKDKNERACRIMLQEGFDSLVVVSKEYPENIVMELLPFVKPSRPVVVFSLYKEVLISLYTVLKSTSKIINLRLTSNWMRSYQVLPNRTHPNISMLGNGGYLLTGYTVQ